MQPRILSIAGSDSGGGAGIQADIKTASALGVFAATAVTAVTVQNTVGVTAVQTMTPEIVSGQIDAVLSDLGADAIKIGMLATAQICRVVADMLKDVDCPIVLDPVMVATSGDKLLDDDAIEILSTQLAHRATVLTPNLPEFDLLCGLTGPSSEERLDAAMAYVKRTGSSLVIKGGHDRGPVLQNHLVTPEKTYTERYNRIDTRHTHGTGCTMSSAIACYLARGDSLPEAFRNAGDFVHNAIKTAPGLGKGHGPLNFIDP